MQAPCEADLDAHGFGRGYNNPLAMMGVKRFRGLPGRNAMLANEAYVLLNLKIFTKIFFCFGGIDNFEKIFVIGISKNDI